MPTFEKKFYYSIGIRAWKQPLKQKSFVWKDTIHISHALLIQWSSEPELLKLRCMSISPICFAQTVLQKFEIFP